jgi:Amt family ammonium transporter
MTFACITPALIVGAFAERVKFSALILFTVLWVTFIYLPIAHMVWYWGGPDSLAGPAKALAEAAAPAKAAAQAELDKAVADAGIIFQWGALDFAGGTVVHINAGIAGLVAAIVIGKRKGYPNANFAPHNLVLSLVGASLLWVGWFGFNAGSALAADGRAGMAMLVTMVASASGALAWMFAEWAAKGKPSVLGIISGAIAGLVAITPAAGFVFPGPALIIGAVAGLVCFWASTSLKNAMGYDDSLDCFGVHGVGGIVGALLTGVFAAGTFTATATSPDGYQGLLEGNPGQFLLQVYGVVITVIYTAVVTFVLLKIVDVIMGLRVEEDIERDGLDIGLHGEMVH